MIYRAMVDGEIESRIFPADSLSDAQVDMLNFYRGQCHEANIIAMTEDKAMEYLLNSISTVAQRVKFCYEDLYRDLNMMHK